MSCLQLQAYILGKYNAQLKKKYVDGFYTQSVEKTKLNMDAEMGKKPLK